MGPTNLAAGTTRLYALDNLRALMMWLGIVLHVAAIHMVNESPLPWRDERTTVVADLLTAFIHAFRMPVGPHVPTGLSTMHLWFCVLTAPVLWLRISLNHTN